MGLAYNEILRIPQRAVLNGRLTKAFFLKNFKLGAAEKKLLNNNIASMAWLASIKVANTNIPEVKNELYVFEEIQAIVCTLQGNNLQQYGKRCVELIQKHIPYQAVLIVEDDHEFILNTCDKRVNQNEPAKRTIDNYFTTPALSKLYKNEVSSLFYASLDFARLDKTDMEALYKSYILAIVQYQAACITGNYRKRTQKRTEQDMADLLAIEAIEKEITSLRSQLQKETQLNAQVNLNVVIQKKKEEVENLKNKLSAL